VEYVDGKARFVVDEAFAAAAAAMKPKAFVAKGQLGAQAPLGFWDPLGYCEGITEMDFKKLRSSEIKHGRLAMMATIGFITPFYAKLPGYLSPSKDIKFEDIPVGITAISKVPAAGWVQILLFAAVCEFGLGPSIQEWKEGQPGDYGRGALGMFGPITDPVKKARSLSAEISNGRLAMAAITGMILQNGITGGTDAAMWFGSSALARNAKVVEYVDGKARFVVDEAFAAAAAAMKPKAFVAKGQLGAQAPLGFWDPLGYCEGITEMDFKKLRSSEIKHGRLAMMATIGFITPFYAKLPGYLSPSKDIKFEDIPVGITAISKVPAAGWVQILLFAAVCEFGLGPSIQEWKEGQPGDYGRGALGMFGPITDPVKKARSLSAEISNGRLAMAAITGMILQNGITGGTDSPMWFGNSP